MQNNTCQIADHDQKRIHAICFCTKCEGKRVCCQRCLVEFHSDHIAESVDLDDILKYIKTSSNQPGVLSPQVNQALIQLSNAQNYLEGLLKLIKQEIGRLSSFSLQTICKDIGKKYNILQGQVEGLQNQQWNSLAQDMLRDFKVQNGKITINHSFVNQLGEQYEKFIKEFSLIMIKIVQEFNLSEQMLELRKPTGIKFLNQPDISKPKKINFEDFTESPVLTGHTHFVLGIDICKQRNLLASGSSDETVRLWSLVDNSCLKTYAYSGLVLNVVFSNQGNLLAFGGYGNFSVKLIDISDLKKDQIIVEFKGHSSTIYRLTFSNDSKYLISGSDDEKIIIWDIVQKKKSFQLSLEHDAHGVAISGDDTLIASNSYSGGQVNIWSFQNKKLLCSQKAHSYGSGVEFSRDQKMLVSSGFSNDGMIKLWSLDQLNQSKLLLIREFKAANNNIWTVLFSPCDRFIISMCNQDREIKVIDSQTGEVVKLFKSRATNDQYIQYSVQAAISKDMDIIAYGEDENIAVWRLK